jgi:diaminopimelate epimerase
MTSRLAVFKAHAYGNDFLLVPEDSVSPEPAGSAQADAARAFTARELCHRHHGIGADGLILYTLRAGGATMKIWNADGSRSELSGNGLRCLGALVAHNQRIAVGASLTIDTDAGVKTLELLARDGERYTFRAAMGLPEDLRQISIPVGGESVKASVLRLGNPQCVVLGSLPDSERFHRLGPALATHTMFPAGTNVEFAHVEAPGRVRILIWERGVGPTSSSGTGTSASAVAAAAHGGAAREVDVIAPGGTQRVEWREDGVYLTGWAELILEGGWLKPL